MNANKPCLLSFVIAMVLASCNPVATNGQTPKAGPLVSTGQVETVELGPTVENVWNCGDGGGTIVKHPSRSISSNHSVEWEVGGTSGVGVTIGEGVVPGGVELSTSLEGHYRSQFDTSSQQSTSWDLPAEPNTIVDYTLIWRETWETGYIDVLMPNNSNTRVNVRYRTNIGSEIVGKQIKTCDGSVIVPEQPTQSDSLINPTVSSTSTQQSSQINFDGWVICWHGKFDYEYLIAYPESSIKQGLNLSILLPQPWGGGTEYLPNDSIKMCFYKGIWYGDQSTPWFPYASYIILQNDEFLVCQDSPNCSGDTWTMKSVENPPYMQTYLRQPTGYDIQVLGYK